MCAPRSSAPRLGNTPTVCRKCYIHPAILKAYRDGAPSLSPTKPTSTQISENGTAMKPEEIAIYDFLRHRLRRRTN
jgi:DNA topoisomerase I